MYNDKWIKKQALENRMIVPFVDKQKEDGIISYGLSSYGYDIRLGTKFKTPKIKQSLSNLKKGWGATGYYHWSKDKDNTVIDPKSKSPAKWRDFESHKPFAIEPLGFLLAHTVERFNIPRDTMAVCLGKSTYARCGIIINVTPLEPEWSGYLTLEIHNTTQLPVMLYPNEGIAQLAFMKPDEICEFSYADKNGKYQNQDKEPVNSRVK